MPPRIPRNDVALATYPSEMIEKISKGLGLSEHESSVILNTAITGGESTNEASELHSWIDNRLLPHTVFIDQTGYTEMCLDALKTISTQVLTDFGSSRQRDFGQAWADTIRGYLGEYALVKYLENRYELQTRLAHQAGVAEDFFDTDISEVLKEDIWRKPHINIGVKTAKLNGVWFDVPQAQFQKSNIHVQVKIGAGTTHLFSFFKSLSVFRDKILKAGLDSSYLSQEESDQIWNDIPEFKPIPAYIVGFVNRDDYTSNYKYSGSRARLHYTINKFEGLYSPEVLEEIKNTEQLPKNGKVKFSSIEKFSGTKFVFNSGSLYKSQSEWQTIIDNV